MSIACRSCKFDNDSHRRYCGNCAAELGAGCASCGFVNRAADRFCGGCARPTTPPRASQPVLPKLPRAARTLPPNPPPAKGTIAAQTDARTVDRMHTKTTVPIERFDVISEAPER